MKPSLNNISGVYAGVNAAWNVYKILTAPALEVPEAKGPFRPREWDSQDAEIVQARTSISFLDARGVESASRRVTYFFDAIMRLEHVSPLRITEHPIQTGANISDHAFLLPKRLTLEIGMSDVMDVFVAGQFSDFSSKSISAYQALLRLQSYRYPLTVTTRLDTYENMLVEQIAAQDDSKTTYGLKALIYLKQIITTQVPVTEVISARQNVTKNTDRGPVQTKPLDNSSVLSRSEKSAKNYLQKSRTGSGATGGW